MSKYPKIVLQEKDLMPHFTKPGVYIADCSNASFSKESNSLPLDQGVRVSTIAATHPINIGTPETFKIGDRVKVYATNSFFNGRYGVVTTLAEDTSLFKVMIKEENPAGSWFRLRELKKEFAVGDRVASNQSLFFCTVKRHAPVTNTYLLAPLDGSPEYYTIAENLTYAPEEKKPTEDLVVNTSGNLGITPNSFRMNQPIHMDKQAENRLHVEDVHKIDIRFMTQAEIDRELVDKHYLYMTEVKIEYKPQTTYSATIVLASGRVVNIPAPDANLWELKDTTKLHGYMEIVADVDGFSHNDEDGTLWNHDVLHDQGKCWLSDMSRIINDYVENGPFETKFSYITEIRKYVRKPVGIGEVYPCCYSTLRNLW